MVLRLAPQLVQDHQHVVPQAPGDAFLPATRAWTMPDRSEHGHIGDPREATAEKGEALFADMGHIGRNPIMTTWYGIVLPAHVHRN